MHFLFPTELFAGKVTQAFCWTLIHSLWQGLFFTVITGIILMCTTKSPARIRYNIVAGLFFGFLGICCLTFIKELNSTTGQAQVLLVVNTGSTNEHGLQTFIKGFINYLTSHASIIVMLWFVVFCFKGAQLATALVYNRRVKSRQIAPSYLWQNKLSNLRVLLQVRRGVQLFESGIIKIPVVIGHIKPVIFIPLGLLTSLPAAEVEAVLLHELAHIRRNDYLVNMLQVVAEIIFFFNPALLWMSYILREERENCCDDIAVTHLKNKKQYIQALVSFKEHSLYAGNYAIAFPAARNQLLKRVSRIIKNSNNTLDRSGKIFSVVSFFSLAILSIAATGWEANLIVAKQEVKKQAPLVKLIQTELISLAGSKKFDAFTKTVTTTNRNLVTRRNVNTISNISSNFNKHVRVTLATEDNKNTAGRESEVMALADGGQTQAPLNTRLDYKQQADLYRVQAEKDREQAMKDRKQAELDRIQAQKDREQAIKDMKQAEVDRKQAERDRKQAQQDRQRAEEDRV